MRIPLLAAAISSILCGAAHAEGTFISLDTPNLYLTTTSANGQYAVGTVPESSGARWSASTGQVELLPDLIESLGVNNAGTITGAVIENGGSEAGGNDYAAIAAVGGSPVLLTGTLDENSVGYGVSEDNTVVGLSFDSGFNVARAFVWNATDGMSALPVARTDEYSRADVISADGRVIAGWNDGPFGRSNVIWVDREPLVLTESDGYEVGAATGMSRNGEFVVGGDHMDEETGDYGAWRWSQKTGMTFIPGMAFAFGVSGDGKTVIGNTDFFDEPARAAMIWREGIGTISLVQFLSEQGITVPDGWDPVLAGGFGGMSEDGRTMAGFAYGPLGEIQSFIIQIPLGDSIFADGFESAAN